MFCIFFVLCFFDVNLALPFLDCENGNFLILMKEIYVCLMCLLELLC